MMKETESITVQVGTFEGMPITETLSEKEIREARKAGFSESDLIDLVRETHRDWQADC
ncbi:MAG: hypothetical protein JJE45_00240 [Prolixibacteraceae bacterium]|nr:hypothetical protein [Prolixibacteraceae bacterium]